MSVHGRVDITINPSDSSLGRRANEVFANICEFFLGPNGMALGITLIASSTGSNASGLGFWDDGGNAIGAAGRFTWCVFRFNNAPKGQFDMMMLLTTGSGQSISPFNISQNGGTVFGANNAFGMAAVAFAAHPSGSTTHPWNGTNVWNSGALGSGNIVWQTGSGGQPLAVWPRANAGDGTYAAQRNYLTQMHDDGQFGIPCRMHLICTEGSFTLCLDYSLNNAYHILHFGSFTPLSGSAPYDSPYFFWSGQSVPTTNVQAKLYNSLTYGGTAGQSFNTLTDGGVTIPSVASGTKNVCMTTVGGTNIDGNIGSFTPYLNSGTYHMMPAYVCAQDVSPFNAILGIADYMNLAWGPLGGTVNAVSSTVAFGQAASTNLKVILPWTGSAPGTLVGIRQGREF